MKQKQKQRESECMSGALMSEGKVIWFVVMVAN